MTYQQDDIDSFDDEYDYDDDESPIALFTETGSKLYQLFFGLRSEGFTAEQRVACCSSCALANLEPIAKRKDSLGIVYNHEQDYKNGSPMAIRFAGIDGGMSTTDIAELVCVLALEVGLKYEWDGNPDKVIWVTS